jgi:hypothetical protein
MKGFLKALENGTEYDYIANNSHNMSKDDLATILKEYIYHVNSMGIFEGKEDVLDAIYETISDYVEEENS